MTDRKLDLLCMGRAAVDLYAEQLFSPLENASSFAKYVGGCPANIAIGSSRLGLKTGILSRVGNEAMGRFVRETMRQEGVDISTLKTDPDRLTALVLLGICPPDHFPLIFYRENCADMAIDQNDFDIHTFEQTKALLISGTHCSTEAAFETTVAAANLAKQAQTKLILDIDYRPVLWGATGHGGGEERYVAHKLFAQRVGALLHMCDLIVGTEEELLAATHTSHIEEAIQEIKRCTQATIVQKQGEKGCRIYESSANSPTEGQPFPVNVLNVLGAGDAFISGFLRGYLKGLSMEECCRLGNANGALVVTRHGCSPAMPYWNELQYFLEHPNEIEHAEHLHHLYERKQVSKSLCYLAFDHRTHFLKIAQKYKQPLDRIQFFKKLLFDAALEIHQEYSYDIGVIVDDEYGKEVLRAATNKPLTIAKPIESANSFPLKFLEGKEAASILRNWPKEHLIKVLVYVIPDAQEIDQSQVNTLQKLYQAAKQTGHQLIIELAHLGKGGDLRSIALTVKGCYKAGVYPSWWKLPPIADEENWRAITHSITRHDPDINGVYLLGGHLPSEQLVTALIHTRQCCPYICGFAIGRSIWDTIAEEWFLEKIDSEQAKKQIKMQFQTLLESWNGSVKHKEVYDDCNVEERRSVVQPS